jgi:hypothetical protein
LEHLKLGLSIYQVMNKHKCRIKEMMENNGELSKDLFLSEQDIRNLARKLAKKDKYKVFFYQESGGQVEGSFQNNHMPFTIGIHTKWKKR